MQGLPRGPFPSSNVELLLRRRELAPPSPRSKPPGGVWRRRILSPEEDLARAVRRHLFLRLTGPQDVTKREPLGRASSEPVSGRAQVPSGAALGAGPGAERTGAALSPHRGARPRRVQKRQGLGLGARGRLSFGGNHVLEDVHTHVWPVMTSISIIFRGRVPVTIFTPATRADWATHKLDPQ